MSIAEIPEPEPIVQEITPANNNSRAAWAQAAVKAFAVATRYRGNTEPGDENHGILVADLIADIGHYAKRHGLDYLDLLESGIGMWSAENRDPEPGGNDHVTVTIEQYSA
jgi:hypothetical protein